MAAVAHFQGARDTLRSRRARWLTIARRVCAGIVILACAGFASTQRVSLTWSAPGGCPQAAGVRAALDRLLAQAAEGARALEAAGRVERVRGRYRLTLRLSIGAHRAQRVLESESCDELAATAAWLIAVAVDPSVEAESRANGEEDDAAGAVPAGDARETAENAGRAPEPAAPGPGAPRSRPEQAPAPAHAEETAPRRGRAWAREARLAALAGVSLGTAGGAQAELGGAGGVGVGWLYSELAFSALLPRREELAAGGTVRSWSLALGLRECALWGAELRWGPCLTLDGVRTVGRAEGLSSNQEEALFWAVAGIALRAAWHLRGRLELTLLGGAGLPVSARPRFTVEGVGEVMPVSVLPGYVRVGVGWLTH